jgi:hypothetical protein
MDLLLARRLLDVTDRFLREAVDIGHAGATETVIDELEDVYADLFAVQGAAFIAELARQAGPNGENLEQVNWDGVFAAAVTAGAAIAAQKTAVQIAAAMAAGAAEQYGGLVLGLSFDVNNPKAQEYLRQHAAELIAGIDETTKKRMNTLIVKAREEGWSYDKLAEEIKSRWDGFAQGQPQEHIDSRAHLVAVTETGNAYEEGAYQAALQARDLGIQLEKSWLTVGDERVCSEQCEVNEGAGWIAADEEFPSGHLHPLAHPACRCTALYRRKAAR